MSERILVYTCHVGAVEMLHLREPYPCTVDWLGYKRIGTGNSRYDSRRLKILSHEWLPQGYDIYIWTDSTEMIGVDILPFVEKYLKDADMCTLTEPEEYGNTIWGATYADFINNRTSLDAVRRLFDIYRKEGIPRDWPIYHLSLIMRRNNEKTIEFNNIWWNTFEEIMDPEYAFMDQEAFSMAALRTGMKINTIPREEEEGLTIGTAEEGADPFSYRSE